jgi:hypothetical protein
VLWPGNKEGQFQWLSVVLASSSLNSAAWNPSCSFGCARTAEGVVRRCPMTSDSQNKFLCFVLNEIYCSSTLMNSTDILNGSPIKCHKSVWESVGIVPCTLNFGIKCSRDNSVRILTSLHTRRLGNQHSIFCRGRYFFLLRGCHTAVGHTFLRETFPRV